MRKAFISIVLNNRYLTKIFTLIFYVWVSQKGVGDFSNFWEKMRGSLKNFGSELILDILELQMKKKKGLMGVC